MRTLTCLFCLLTLVSAVRKDGSPFRAGWQYIYAYEGQQASGIPANANAFSGMKIVANVILQFKTATEVVCKVDLIELGKFNEVIAPINPAIEMLPNSLLEAITGPETAMLMKNLALPFTFIYVNGDVTDIKVSPEDPFWSVNVKKSVATMLQMDMVKRRPLDQKNLYETPEAKPAAEHIIHTVLEPSVAGSCETTYKVKQGQGDVLHVSKVRNYENCIDRPVLINTMFTTVDCDECKEKKSKPFQAAAEMSYTIIGSKTEFKIVNCQSMSRYVMMPYSMEAEHAVTFIRQALILLKEVAITPGSAIPVPIQLKKLKNGLTWAVPQQGSHPWPIQVIDSVNFQTQEAIHGMIETTLAAIVDLQVLTEDPEAAILVNILKKHLRKATKETMNAIIAKYIAGQSAWMVVAKRVLCNVLPSVGTFDAAQVLVGAIQNGHIAADEAATSISLFALAAQPDINILTYILNFAISETAKQNVKVHRAVWLGLGAVAQKVAHFKTVMINDWHRQLRLIEMVLNQGVKDEMIAKENEIKGKISLVDVKFDEAKQNVMKALGELVKNGNVEEKVLGIKAIGNAGLVDCLPILIAVLGDQSVPRIVRVQAIWAFRRIAPKAEAKKQVLDILAPHFFNKNEAAHIRIAAYLMIIEANPPLPVLQMIAHSLHLEKDANVGSFVYSSLQQLATSAHPCMLGLAKNVRATIRYCKRFERAFPYSCFYHWSAKNKYLNMAGAVTLATISTSDEMVPKAAVANVGIHLWGAAATVVEVGFNTEGIQSMLSQIFGINFQASRRVQNIKDQFKISDRESIAAAGIVYVKFFGHELYYVPLAEIVATVKSKITANTATVPIEVTRSIIFADFEYAVPTELGMPLLINMEGTAVINTVGTVTVTTQAANSGANRILPAQVIVNINVTPRVVTFIHAFMAVDYVGILAGVSVHGLIRSKVPVDVKATINTVEGKVITEFGAAQLKGNLMTVEFNPATFIMHSAFDVTSVFPNFRPVPPAPTTTVVPMFYAVGKEAMGINFAVSGQAAWTGLVRNALVPYNVAAEGLVYVLRSIGSLLSGRQIYGLAAMPGINPPAHYKIEGRYVRMGPAAPASSIEESGENCGIYCYASSAFSWFGSAPQSQEESAAQIDMAANHTIIIAITDSNQAAPRTIGIEANAIHGVHDTSIIVKVAASLPPWQAGVWKMEMKIEIAPPKIAINPKEIFSPHYQMVVQKQIEELVAGDKGHVTYHQLKTDAILLEAHNWAKAMKGWGAKEMLAALIEQIFVSMKDKIVMPIGPVIAAQKEVIAALDKMKTVIYSADEVGKHVHLVELAAQKSQVVMDKIVAAITVAQKEMTPMEITMLEYSIVQQMYMVRGLFAVCNKARAFLPMEVGHACLASIKSQCIKYNNIVAPNAAAIHKVFAVIPASNINTVVMKLVGFQSELQKKLPLPFDDTKPRPDIPEAEFPELLNRVMVAIKEVDAHIMKGYANLDEMTQMMLLNAALQQVQIVETARIYIAAITERAVMLIPHQSELRSFYLKSSPRQFKSEDQNAENLSSAMSDAPVAMEVVTPTYLLMLERTASRVDWVATKIARRLACVVYCTINMKSIAPLLPEEQKPLLHKIIQARINQAIAGDLLLPMKANYASSYGDITLPQVRKGMQVAKAVMVFVKEELVVELKKRSVMVPLVAEAVKCVAIQEHLLTQAIIAVREAVILNAAKKNTVALKELVACEVEAEAMIAEHFLLYKMVLSDLLIKSASANEVAGMNLPFNNHFSVISQMIHAVMADIYSQEYILREVGKLGAKISQGRAKIWQVIGMADKCLAKLENINEKCNKVDGRIPMWAKSIQQLKSCVQKQAAVIQSVMQMVNARAKELPEAAAILAHISESGNKLKRISEAVGAAVDARPAAPPMAAFPAGFHADIVMSYGMEGVPIKEFNVKVIARKGIEQLMWEQEQMSPLTRNRIAAQFVDDLIAERGNAGHAFKILHREMNAFKHVNIIAAFHKDAIPAIVKNFVVNMYVSTKATFIGHLSTEYIWNENQIQENVVQVTMAAKRNGAVMDMAVRTGSEIAMFSNIVTCYPLRPIFTFVSSRLPIRQQIIKYATNGKLPAECRLIGNTVHTLDKAAINLPIAAMPGCEAVLAMDCSNSSHFAMTVESLHTKQKAVKFIVEQQTIEVILSETAPVVKINGRPRAIADKQVVTIPIHAGSSVAVEKKGKAIVISVPQKGLEVFVRGENVAVKASAEYWSKLCGLCGNYDGQANNDMAGPSKAQHTNPRCFVASYLISSPQCNAWELKENCSKARNIPPRRRMMFGGVPIVRADACTPYRKTVSKIHRSRERRSVMYCVSMEGVVACPASCKAEGGSMARVQFACVPLDSAPANALRKRMVAKVLLEKADILERAGQDWQPQILEVMNANHCGGQYI